VRQKIVLFSNFFFKKNQATYDYGHSIFLRTQDCIKSWTLPTTAHEQPRVLERLMGQCRQDSDPPALPRGLTVCVSLTATHGDLYYVGLNAIELFDEAGVRISVDAQQVVFVYVFVCVRVCVCARVRVCLCACV